MDVFYRLIEKKWVLLVAGVVVGLVLGLFYAWIIDPVEWKNGIPSQLRDDLRQDYLRMAIDSYSVNGNVNLAVSRYENLGKFANETLEKVGANPENVSPNALQNFRSAVENFAPSGQQGGASGGSTSSETGGGLVGTLVGALPYVCGAVFLIAVAVFGVILIRRRMQAREEYPDNE